MKLETVPCDLCGDTPHRVLFEAENSRLQITQEKFPICECLNCGLTRTSPRPTQDELQPFYAETYYQPSNFPVISWLNRFFAKERVRFIKKFKLQGTVLDVGCGTGNFLHLMKQEGFTPNGLEPSNGSLENIPQNLRSSILHTSLSEAVFKENSMDVITLWHVLEHLPSPVQSLQKIRPWLKSNGTLIIEVPNFGCSESKWLKQNWFALDAPRHFWHFTPHTLKCILEKAGFSVIHQHSSLLQMPSLSFTYLFSSIKGFYQYFFQKTLKKNPAIPIQWILYFMGLLLCILNRMHSLHLLRVVAIPSPRPNS